MRRVALIALLAAALIIPATAKAGTRAATPSGGCSWRDNGREQDGWICLCERVKFNDGWQVWCAWHLATTVDGKIVSRKKSKAAKAKLVVRTVAAHA